MKNEIKEILSFKENADYKKLSYDEIKVLLDYITNLQEENKNLKIELNVVRKDYKQFMKRTTEYEDYLLQENQDYKSRNEKAIEYITSEESINIFTSINAREKWLKINHKLLNILNGDDE